jgi:hypothetical protein
VAFGAIAFLFIASFSCCSCRNICPAVTACIFAILQALAAFAAIIAWIKTLQGTCSAISCGEDASDFVHNKGNILAGVGGLLALIGGILGAVAGCQKRRAANILILAGSGGGGSTTSVTTSGSMMTSGGYIPGPSPGWEVPHHHGGSINAGDEEARRGLMQDFA